MDFNLPQIFGNVSGAGNAIGGFLGGVANPLIGGTTQTVNTTTSKPDSKTNNTMFIVVGVLVFAVLAVGAYILTRKKAA